MAWKKVIQCAEINKPTAIKIPIVDRGNEYNPLSFQIDRSINTKTAMKVLYQTKGKASN